jgi:hypothetical protein
MGSKRRAVTQECEITYRLSRRSDVLSDRDSGYFGVPPPPPRWIYFLPPDACQIYVTNSSPHILPALPNRQKNVSLRFRESSTYTPTHISVVARVESMVFNISFREGGFTSSKGTRLRIPIHICAFPVHIYVFFKARSWLF